MATDQYQPRLRTSWQRAVRCSTVRANDKLAALVLSTYMDADGQGARPSLVTWAADCGVSRATLGRSVQRLVDAGLLSRARSKGGRRGETGLTTLWVPEIPEHLAARLELTYRGLQGTIRGETLPGLRGELPSHPGETVAPSYRLTESDKPSHLGEQTRLTAVRHKHFLLTENQTLSPSHLGETVTLWSSVLELLEADLDEPIFAMWIRDLLPEDSAPGALVLRAPSAYVAEKVRSRFVDAIARAAREATGSELAVEVLSPGLIEEAG